MQLSPTEITYLAGVFDAVNPLSPFVNNKKEPAGSEARTLADKGVLQAGHLTKEAEALLSPLAAPDRCARMVLQKPFCLLEKYTYRTNGRLTLAESDGSGLVITALEEDAAPVVEVLDDFVSHSAVKTAHFQLTLPAAAAMVLMACIDLCRMRALGAYQTGGSVSLAFRPEDIVGQLTGGFVNGLAYGLAGNCGVEPPQGERLPDLLRTLAEAGCIEPAEGEEGSYKLTAEYLLFARSFLIYDSLLLLEAFQLTGENKVAASFELIFMSGMHDNISLALGPQGFEITSLSGEELRGRIRETLDCPAFTEA